MKSFHFTLGTLLSAVAVVLITIGLVRIAMLELVTVIPRDAITQSAMTETFYRARIFVQKNGRMPKSLNDLPKRDGYRNRVTDGWGRALITEFDSDRIGLASLGRDGRPGGIGDHADMKIVVRFRNPDRTWTIDELGWFRKHQISQPTDSPQC